MRLSTRRRQAGVTPVTTSSLCYLHERMNCEIMWIMRADFVPEGEAKPGESRTDQHERGRLDGRRHRARRGRHHQVFQLERLRYAGVVTRLDREGVERGIGRPAIEPVDRTDLPDELRAAARQVERDPEALAFEER